MLKITEEMLFNAIYSVNKRAKNYRDQKRKGKKNAASKEREMYDYKDLLLTLKKPVFVAVEFGGYARKRVYEYDDDYLDQFIEHAFKGDICWNRFSQNEIREVLYFDYETETPRRRFYKAYNVNGHIFHTPVFAWELPSLPMIKCDTLITEGEDEGKLMGMAEVKEIIDAIRMENYSYTDKTTCELPKDTEDPEKKYDKNQIKAYWPMISKSLSKRVPGSDELFEEIRSEAEKKGYSRELCESVICRMYPSEQDSED